MKRSLRWACVASSEPLPGRESPKASVRQFIELAVNMPLHEPQVGQALRSTCATCSSDTWLSPASIMASIRSSLRSVWLPLAIVMTLPASMGPPETKITGMFRRIAAISMPGVILSQLLMHTNASAQWALTMYSTLSAIRSRLGRL